MTDTLPDLYPLKFQPILKKKIWGGDKLKTLLNKPASGNIGESWEISGVADNVSLIANGPLKGKSLLWLLENYREKVVGQEVFETFGTTFPLLFKFIDAEEVLSVQVHPGDDLAKTRHNSFGKTEMWYILDVAQDAELIVGFENETTKEDYEKAVETKSIPTLLKSEKISQGDVFIIQPGTVHAIGAGVLLAEIQQTSDITYRIYDWDRPGMNGELRELHTELALDAIDFSKTNSRVEYHEQLNVPVQIGKTAFFAVNKITITKPFKRALDFTSSFKIYMCVEGEAVLTGNHKSEVIKKGETILIPATLAEIDFISSEAIFLEIYIP